MHGRACYTIPNMNGHCMSLPLPPKSNCQDYAQDQPAPNTETEPATSGLGNPTRNGRVFVHDTFGKQASSFVGKENAEMIVFQLVDFSRVFGQSLKWPSLSVSSAVAHVKQTEHSESDLSDVPSENWRNFTLACRREARLIGHC